MKCTQPGCSGDIEDGYCNVCGMPPTPGPAAAPAVPRTPTAAVPTPTKSPGPARSSGPSPAGSRPPAPPGSAPNPPARPSSAPVTPANVSAAAPATSRGVPGARPAKQATAVCRQPGCTGRIIDGYCDVCGAPPAGAPSPGAAVSTVTRGSVQLGSTALGSARVLSANAPTRRVGTGRLRSARLGAGLTVVPAAPEIDPAQVVMADPVVPEERRNCPNCGAPVGRSSEGKPGRTEGFCPNCRRPYSFDAKLRPGDLVANQYRIVGPLAHGGMGWVYLARDQNVSDRWVVLKGLLNAGDADALAATISEQRFLAQVEHPLIVEIYNFVTHDGAGYIVMEYVGGRSLKQLLKERLAANGGVYDPLPVEQAIAFIVEILPAFSYLHEQGLLYCDFKPDNLIQVGDSVKLIDLGGVRRADDDHSPIFGTVGYQAPEVSTLGASVASDIFTIGRTLMVLCSEFKGYQSTYEFTLPPVSETPLFTEYDSFHRLLAKCCALAPADRFSSADELRVQLLGVLREVVGSKTPGVATSTANSLLFDPPLVSSDRFDWRQLPKLRLDTTDPNYAWLASIDLPDPVEALAALSEPPQSSAEIYLARCDAALRLGNQQVLRDNVNALLTADPWEWRAVWMAGLGALIAGDYETAKSSFNAVYGQVPGELAPKLALAVACENGSDEAIAERLYQICASTDANYVTAAGFGLARIRAQRGDLRGALDALDLVPSTSRGFNESRRLKAEHILSLGKGLPDLAEAMKMIRSARLDSAVNDEFEVTILEKALAEVEAKGAAGSLKVGDTPATENSLRDRLEVAYRQLARHKTRPDDRTILVDKANRIRRWSLT